MPDMNGYEATEKIRTGQAGEDNTRLPIIAMTAHALPEFREKAAEVGMNDFITKPVDFHNLQSILERHAGRDSAADVPCEPRNEMMLDQMLDRRSALGRIGGDEALLEELLDIFAQGLPLKIEALKNAARDDDWDILKKTTHGLKGSCSSIGATACYHLAIEIEKAIARQTTNEIKALIHRFTDELTILLDSIKNR